MLRWLFIATSALLFGALIAGAGAVGLLYHYGRGLPDYKQLADYEPPVVTRVHAGDGRLLAEYATEKRVFVPIEAMPRRVIKAFLSAEDKNFYSHPGVDLPSLFRAVVVNLRNLGEGRRPVGASTITQQVAKNFLLGNEVSIERKVREAILAFRIERAFTKDRILELYLNEIYLGFGSYGVAAAALNYFNKSLDDLTVAEAAYLAALPKAPNNYHPTRQRAAAIGRRNWVIDRMVENGFIAPEEGEAAQRTPLAVRQRDDTEFVTADYFAEEVRRELYERFGERGLYGGGLSVRTTLDPRLQSIATRSLRAGLEAYDRRHGWRGPVARLAAGPGWQMELARVVLPDGLSPLRHAIVLSVGPQAVRIGLPDGREGTIPLAEMRWAREARDEGKVGPPVRSPDEVLTAGDVVVVAPVEVNADGQPYQSGTFALRQLPEVGGGLVALDPHTGRVLAMAGGYSYAISQFNRVTQARRQPGSSFKPFVYLAGLDSGLTPSTLILDAPFVIDQGPGLGKWRPGNYTNKFYGPTPMRVGIEQSRNLMTVRLAQTIGMERVADVAEAFGVVNDLPEQLSMALGAGETTLLRMAVAYAMLVNGGKRITPTLIDRIQDRHGRTIYRHDERPCPACRTAVWDRGPPPVVPDEREQIANPVSAYQVVSMLQGVVERGTGRRIASLGRPLAGKTGTTNDYLDAWFVGFSPDLAVGTYVGFDQPKTLGNAETGSSAAVPIFKQFMEEALDGKPAIPFRVPPGVRLVRVNGEGRLAAPGDRPVILEAFRPGSEPQGEPVLIDGGQGMPTAGSLGSGGGEETPAGPRGLY